MGFLDNLANRYGYTKSVEKSASTFTTSPGGFFSGGGSGGAQFTSFNNVKEQMAAYTDWVYSAARAIAEEAATIDLRLYLNRAPVKNATMAHKMIYDRRRIASYQTKKTKQIVKDASGKLVVKTDVSMLEELENHPLLDLLDCPNPYMTRMEFFELTFLHLELTGNCYWAVERETENGPPTELWPLMPNLIQVVPDKDKYILGYLYNVDGKQKAFAPRDIIHHKYPNPQNFYVGISTVQAAAIAIDSDKHAGEYNRKLFYNQAMPDAVLESDHVLDEQVYKRLRTEWGDTYGGSSNAHKTAILEEGLTYKPMVLTQKDMDFFNARNFNRDQILAMFRVPKSKVGLNEDVNRAAAETAEYTFAKGVIRPKMLKLTSRITEDLAIQFADDIFVSFTDPVTEDKAFLLQEKVASIGTSTNPGWKSQNEIRVLEGDLPVEGADELYIPNNVLAVSELTERLNPQEPESEADNPQEDNPDLDENDSPKPGSDGDEEGTQVEDTDNNSSAGSAGSTTSDTTNADKSATAKKKDKYQYTAEEQARFDEFVREVRENASRTNPEATKEPDPSPDDLRAHNYAKRNRLAKEFEILFMRGSREIFVQQKEEVLKTVNERFGKGLKSKKVTKASTNNLFNKTKNNAAWAAMLSPLYTNMSNKVGTMAMAQVGNPENFHNTTDAITQYFSQRSGTVSKGIDAETDKQLRATLTEGIQNGESGGELADRVENVYGAASGYRADRIARTESQNALQFSSQQAWKQSGVVEKLRWVTDGNPCPICAPMDGQVSDDKWEFSIEGPIVHVNCECDTEPILITNAQTALTAV